MSSETRLRKTSRAPWVRLRHAVRFFFRSEAAEAELRVAIDDAGAAMHLFVCLGAIAEKVAERAPKPAQLEAFTEATADMLIGYLRSLR